MEWCLSGLPQLTLAGACKASPSHCVSQVPTSSPWLVLAGHPPLTVSLRSPPAHPGWYLRNILLSLCLSGPHQLTLAGTCGTSSSHCVSLVPTSSPWLGACSRNSPSYGSGGNLILPDAGCGLCMAHLPGSPPRWPSSDPVSILAGLLDLICSPPRWSCSSPLVRAVFAYSGSQPR